METQRPDPRGDRASHPAYEEAGGGKSCWEKLAHKKSVVKKYIFTGIQYLVAVPDDHPLLAEKEIL